MHKLFRFHDNIDKPNILVKSANSAMQADKEMPSYSLPLLMTIDFSTHKKLFLAASFIDDYYEILTYSEPPAAESYAASSPLYTNFFVLLNQLALYTLRLPYAVVSIPNPHLLLWLGTYK